MSAFLDRGALARLFKVTPQKLAELRKGELAAKGFPAPTLGTMANERWDPLVIEAWRRRQIPEDLRTADTPAADNDDAAIAAELDGNAAALAKRVHH